MRKCKLGRKHAFKLQVHERQRGRKGVSDSKGKKKLCLSKKGDHEEVKRPSEGKKCRINVEEVDMFSEKFLLA